MERDGELYILFNKRAAHLDNHAGQVSFPGGRRDPGDRHLLHTAQRELAEELGIGTHQHSPLCRLPARKVISHYFVTPFAARIDAAAEIIPEAGEVAYVFEVPLAFLLKPENAEPRQVEVFGASTTFYSWTYEQETILGATGRMLADLLQHLGADHLQP